MNPLPKVSRAPAGGCGSNAHQQTGTAAGGAALAREHDGQAGRRAKGRKALDQHPHPTVPSPEGQIARRAHLARVPAISTVETQPLDLRTQSKTLTPQCLLENAVELANPLVFLLFTISNCPS